MSDRKKSLEGEMGSGDSDDEFYNVKLPCAPALSSHKQNARQEIKKIYSPSSTKVKYDYKFDSSSDDDCDGDNAGGSDKSRSHPPASGNESGEREGTRMEDAAAKTTNANSLPPTTYMVVEKINEELKNLKKSGSKANAEHTESSGTCKSHVAPGGTTLASQMGLVPPVVVVPSPMAVAQTPVMNMSPLVVQSSVGMTGQNLIPRHMMTVPGNVLTSSNPMGGMITSPNGSMPNSMMAINRMKSHIPAVVGLPGNVVNTTMQAAMQENMMRMAAAAAAAAAGNNILNIPGPGNAVVGVQGGIAGPGSNIMLAVPSSEAVAVPSPGLLVNPGGVISNPAGLMVVGGVMNNVGASTAPKANTITKPGSAGPTNAGLIRMGGNLPGHQTVRPVPPPPPPFLSARHRPPIPSNLQWPTNAKASFAAGSSSASAPLAEAKKASTCGPGDEVKGDDARDSCPRGQCGSESPPTKDLPFAFKNDGSFMEVFKKMKSELNPESSNKGKESSESSEKSGGGLKKAPVILSGLVGKRRGGRVLKTGLVKKVKKEGEAEEEKRPKDAWSMYMAEVKKYREASCEEEGKTRPLVK